MVTFGRVPLTPEERKTRRRRILAVLGILTAIGGAIAGLIAGGVAYFN
jgi:hypothetical protein